MSYVERDGIWHIVARTEDAEAVTLCELRIVQQSHLWSREAEAAVQPLRGG